MSKSKIALLLLILTLIVSACGSGATSTPRPTATTAPTVEATEEATEAAAESATDEATEEATEATEAAVEETEVATEEPTEEATAEMTEAATEEATEAAEETEEATVEVALAANAMATASAIAENVDAAAADAMATASAIAGSVDDAAANAMATASAISGSVDDAAANAMATASAISGSVDDVAANAMATASAIAGSVDDVAANAMATASAISGSVDDAAANAMATASAIAGSVDDLAANAMATASAVVGEATKLAQAATEVPTVKPTIEPTAVPDEATEEATEAAAGDLIPVRLQLQWVAQSQFAGYYAAVAQGFYEAEGLDVTILEGAVDIVPQTVVASGGAEFGIAWVPKVLASREQGADLVNIAQIFQRSGTLEVSFKDKGIEGVADLRGRNVGTWGFGNEHELYAALRAEGIDPNNPDDVTIVQQPFDMSLLLNGEVDAAEAMTYNEYAQVLEQINPETNELYQPDELNVINFNEVGTAMLQDHIFTTETWLAGETNGVSNEDIAVKFIKASLKGWIYARDNFADTVEIVLANGPTLGQGHMTWQLNEINKLIWPSPDGIGIMDTALWEQTVKVALEGAVITEEPTAGAQRSDLAQKAVDELKADGVDVTGADWTAETVEITPGGE